MNNKYKFLIGALALLLLASCGKDNMDDTILGEEEDLTQIVNCALTAQLVQDSFGTSITAFVDGGLEPYLYEWSNGETAQTILTNEGGTYTVTILDAEGCTITVSIETNSSDPCLGYSLNMGVDDQVITATVFGGIAPYVYTWSTGETTESILVVDSGNYSVSVVDAVGCVVYEIVSVTVSNDPCNGFNVAIFQDSTMNILYTSVSGGTGPYVYEWANGSNTAAIEISESGDYEVLVIDANGCTVSSQISVASNEPCANFNLTISLDSLGTSLNAYANGGLAPYFYSWSTGATTNSIPVTSGETYRVEAVDSEGCMIFESYTVQ